MPSIEHDLFRAVCEHWGTHTQNSAHSSLQHLCISRCCGKKEQWRSLLFFPCHHCSLPNYSSFFLPSVWLELSRLMMLLTLCFLSLILSPIHSPKPCNMILRQNTHTNLFSFFFYKHTHRCKVQVDECEYMNKLKHHHRVIPFSFGSGYSSGSKGLIIFYWDPRIM